MKSFKILLIFLALSQSLFSQKKNEFKLVYDTVNSARFNYTNLFVKPLNSIFTNIIPIHIYEGSPLKNTPSNFIYFNPTNELPIGKLSIDERIRSSKFRYPAAIRYYFDTLGMTSSCDGSNLMAMSMPKNDFSDFFQPFYFSKNEVSNREYKEFIAYLQDSIIRKKLGGDYIKISNGDTTINWSKDINYKDTTVLNAMKILSWSSNQRFYKGRYTRTDILNYSFEGRTVNIFPDTLSWVHDFEYSFMEPMTQMYFWHPVYLDYPIVGISYWQAKAFCDWKGKQLQKEFQKENPNLMVSVDLPSMVEWEFVLKNSVNYDLDSSAIFYTVDNGFVTDLGLHSKDFNISPKAYLPSKTNPLRTLLLRNSYTPGDLLMDGTLHTSTSKRKWNKKFNTLVLEYKNNHDIQHMGNNVSEWTNHDYSQWSALFAKRQEYLLSSKTKEDSIVSAIEKYYDARNNKNGKLIIGGNWWDERRSLQLGQNLDGAFAKRFIHPDSAYSTVGFRYVIHVKLKSDTVEYSESRTWTNLTLAEKQIMEKCNSLAIDKINGDTIILKNRNQNDSTHALCDYIIELNCMHHYLSLDIEKLHKDFHYSNDKKTNMLESNDSPFIDGIYIPSHYGGNPNAENYHVFRTDEGTLILETTKMEEQRFWEIIKKNIKN